MVISKNIIQLDVFCFVIESSLQIREIIFFNCNPFYCWLFNFEFCSQSFVGYGDNWGLELTKWGTEPRLLNGVRCLYLLQWNFCSFDFAARRTHDSIFQILTIFYLYLFQKYKYFNTKNKNISGSLKLLNDLG